MASDPTSWTGLKASLANWLNRDDLNTIEIPEAIALAERRFQRTLIAPERETAIDLVLDTETVNLPGDLWGIKALHLDSDPRIVLEPMTLAELRRTYSATAGGRPRHYAISGETLVLGPPPDGAYPGRLTYVRTIPALGPDQESNWLLDDHPDLYLEGALAELHTLLRDGEGAALFEGKCRQSIDEINHASARRLQGGAPIRIRARGVV